MLRTWLNKFVSRQSRPSRRRAAAPLGRPRLRVEHLEDRRVPSTVFWDGGAGTTNWTDRLNWNTDQTPTSSQDVIISPGNLTVRVPANAFAMTLNSNANINVVAGGGLLVGSAILQGGLQLADQGTFATSGDVTIN